MKVAIVGGAPRSKKLAPYDDEEWEIWGLGVHLDHPRLTKIFEIHPDFSGYETEDYPQRLLATGIPLVVHENFPFRGEQIELYPFDQANELMPMLTSSLAYMMAYAILKGATHINIYGVDMDVSDAEYFYQRPGMYAWIGYAKSQGIQVEIPESSLFKDKTYPYCGRKINLPYTENEFLKMAKLHEDKINEYNREIDHKQMLINTHDGMRQVYTRLAKIARATDAGIEVLQIDHSTELRM